MRLRAIQRGWAGWAQITGGGLSGVQGREMSLRIKGSARLLVKKPLLCLFVSAQLKSISWQAGEQRNTVNVTGCGILAHAPNI